MYPFLTKLFADAGYQGPQFQRALVKILPYLETEIVKRSDHVKGFAVLPKRWIVERTSTLAGPKAIREWSKVCRVSERGRILRAD
jgi:transposase